MFPLRQHGIAKKNTEMMNIKGITSGPHPLMKGSKERK